MLPFFKQHAIEIAFKADAAKAIATTFAEDHGGYSTTIYGAMSQWTSKAAFVEQRTAEIKGWFDSLHQQELILDILVPKSALNAVLLFELSQVDRLGTKWGKRHHGKSKAYISTYAFGDSDELEDVLAPVYSSVTKALAGHVGLKRPPKRTSQSTTNQTVKDLTDKAKGNSTVDKPTLAKIQRLTDPTLRNIILRTRQARDPIIKHIAESAGVSEDDTKRIINRAVRHGMLQGQYNAACKHCAHVLARVPAKTSIGQMASDGVTCPKCKTRLTTTSFTTCYVVSTDLAPQLDGSQWMGLHIRELIQAMGVGKTLLEVVDGPNELDIVANVDGDLLLMELKDKRFSIGHAYPFVGKCSQYKPKHAVIVASEGVDSDVKEYITNTGIKAHYLEDLTTINEDLCALFSQFNARKLQALLSQVAWDTNMSRSILNRLDVDMQIDRDIWSDIRFR